MRKRKIIGVDELVILQECQESAWKLAIRIGFISKFIN